MLVYLQSGDKPAARYVSSTMVCEEALDNTRLIGLPWSASGQVQRENTSANPPSLAHLRGRMHVFDVEVDGQELHNNWQWIGARERPATRDGTREAVVELRHMVRPVAVNVVTRLDDTPFLVRYLEITNTGWAPAALAGHGSLRGYLCVPGIYGDQPRHASRSPPGGVYDTGLKPPC